MAKFDLRKLSEYREYNQLEAKKAKGGFPGSFWETYSAFANTDGGIILLGVREENDGRLVPEDVDAEKLKKDFWNMVNNRQKISANIVTDGMVNIEKIEGKDILVVEVPRANYELRPIHVGSNPFGNTYRRNNEGDFLCSDAEVRRMFADAEHDRHSKDSQILSGFNFDRDIDKESLRQYRQTFASLQPTHPWTSIDDISFLKKIRAYAIDYTTGQEGLTMAGLLMFGHYDSITNVAANPSYFVDYREKIGSDNPGVRWTHRIYPDGLWEANLYQFFVRVYNRMIQSLPRPFIIKDGIRQEETPAHDAVREALINCLIHNDINALGNIVVEKYEDKLVFRNPGTMLVSKQQYFKGGRSVCRNPIIQNIFMRLGSAERAGSGVDKIIGGWAFLGLPTPTVEEEVQPDYVVLTMSLKNNITPQDNGETPQDGGKTPQDGGETPQDGGEILQDGGETPQDGGETLQVNDRVIRKEKGRQLLLEFCEEPKTLMEMMKMLNLKDRNNFIERYINPMLMDGTLTMTEPDKPTSRNQRYVRVKPN